MTREEKEQWDIFMKTWVIPALKNTWNEKKCKEIVEALEEWEEQEPWIPVSEKLPEEDKTVIASTDYFAVFPEARYTKDGWEWAYESGSDYWEELKNVIAWMPLPKPYKPRESEEQG